MQRIAAWLVFAALPSIIVAPAVLAQKHPSPATQRANERTTTRPAAAAPTTQPALRVGPAPGGGHIVTTGQLVRPAGRTIEFNGRPVDVVCTADGRTAFVKDNRGLVVIDVAEWKVVQELAFLKGGGSLNGLALSADERHIYATHVRNALIELEILPDRQVKFARNIELPGPAGEERSYPCGVALSANGTTAFVCLSRNNTLALVDLESGTVRRQIDVGVAPFEVVLSADERMAFVSDWGGRRASPGERTASSSGTPVAVDERGVAASGGISIVDLRRGEQSAYIETGLSASDVVLSPDERHLFVANANSDTVSVIDVANSRVSEQISVRPDDALPFGSMPNGLAITPDGGTLFAACAGNNAVAVIDLGSGGGRARVRGRIPAGWYPGGLALHDDHLLIANVKGIGSRNARDGAFNSHRHRGTVQDVAVPTSDAALAEMTRQVVADARIPQVLHALERREAAEDVNPVPVPCEPGQPSVFEHIVYIIKENRTYDQVFGGIGEGNGDPRLCVFGRDVTPNHHALAEQFVLLDNYYCNGVLSADGHSWATEGNVTPYLERSFGGFSRSYTFGDDPLTYSSSGFIWDHVLGAGHSFRNFGEFDYAKIQTPEGKPETWAGVYEDWRTHAGQYHFTHSIGVETMRRFCNPRYPGWNLHIPDQVRADIFLAELDEFEKSGLLPNFMILYLPQDHTSGVSAGEPTPRACVADNDLALGRIVDGLSHSRFWPEMCIFAIEDDPQDGWDHVDGHRSVCLVISPHTKRGEVISDFYCQTSVVHTIEQMLGATAQNQLYAAAPLMTTCFRETPILTPYDALANTIPLDEYNPPKRAAAPGAEYLYELTAAQDLEHPDRANEDEFNRVIWHAVRGVEAPYPREFAGAHGRGLAALGLRHAAEAGVEVEDEE